MGLKIIEKIRNQKMLQWLLVLCGAIAFYMILSHFDAVKSAITFILNVISPIISGTVIAYLLYPIVTFFRDKVFKKFRNRNVANTLAVVITLVLALLVVAGLFAMIIPQMTESASYIISNVGKTAEKISDFLESKTSNFQFLSTIGFDIREIDWQNLFRQAFEKASEYTSGLVGASLNAGSKVLNFLIGLLITVYMLADAERLKVSVKRFVKSLLPKEKYERFAEICEKSHSIIMKYFGDNIKESLIVGVACYIFMTVTKLPYPLLISVIVFVTNFIPNFGPLIGLVISAIPIFIYDPMGVVWFTIFTIISQTIEGYIIQPLMLSDSMGLTPFWVLIAIIIGGGLFGIPGMLLGVPAAAILDYITKEHTNNRLIKNGFPEEVIPVDEDNSQGEQ